MRRAALLLDWQLVQRGWWSSTSATTSPPHSPWTIAEAPNETCCGITWTRLAVIRRRTAVLGRRVAGPAPRHPAGLLSLGHHHQGRTGGHRDPAAPARHRGRRLRCPERRQRWRRDGAGAFDGVRVVELAQWVFVPVAGALLADWGADVIRIERLDGDPYRGLATQGIGTDRGGVNLSMALANRGKRSVALDLRDPRGLDVLHDLLASADVLLTSLRPGALERLGLGADAVRERYPAPDLRARPRLRRQRARRQPARLRQFGVLGARRRGPHPDAHPIGTTRSASAVRWATATAPWRWRSASRRRCSSAPAPATARWSTSHCWPPRCGCCPRTCWRRSTAVRSQPVLGSHGAMVNPLTATYRTKDDRHVQLMFLQGDRYWPDFCRTIGRA